MFILTYVVNCYNVIIERLLGDNRQLILMPEQFYLKIYIFVSVFDRPIKSKLMVCCCCLFRVSCPCSLFILMKVCFVFGLVFCAACKAWSTHRDHVSVVVRIVKLCFCRLICFEGVHQFHSNLTKGSIIKYRRHCVVVLEQDTFILA